MTKESLQSIIDSPLYRQLPRKFFAAYVLSCAEHLRPHLKNNESIKALDTVQSWIDNKVTKDEVFKISEECYKAYKESKTILSEADFVASHIAEVFSYNYQSSRTGVYNCVSYIINISGSPFSVDQAYVNKFLEMIKALSKVEKFLYNIPE